MTLNLDKLRFGTLVEQLTELMDSEAWDLGWDRAKNEFFFKVSLDGAFYSKTGYTPQVAIGKVFDQLKSQGGERP